MGCGGSTAATRRRATLADAGEVDIVGEVPETSLLEEANLSRRDSMGSGSATEVRRRRREQFAEDEDQQLEDGNSATSFTLVCAVARPAAKERRERSLSGRSASRTSQKGTGGEEGSPPSNVGVHIIVPGTDDSTGTEFKDKESHGEHQPISRGGQSSSFSSLDSFLSSEHGEMVRPMQLPRDYVNRIAVLSSAASEGSSVLSSDDDDARRETLPFIPSLPLHWASRFFSRPADCTFNSCYVGASVDEEGKTTSHDERRVIQVTELLQTVSTKYSGNGLMWPHPRSPVKEPRLLPLHQLVYEEVDLRSPKLDLFVLMNIRSFEGHLKQFLETFREALSQKDFKASTLLEQLPPLVRSADKSGLMRVAAVLLNTEAILIDIQCLQADPERFITLVKNSVARNFIHEYGIDCDTQSDQQLPRPSLEEYLMKRFLVDLSYCYQLARKLHHKISRRVK